MARTAVLAVRIITETKDAEKGFDRTADKLGKFEKGLDKATIPAAAAGLAVLGFAKKTGEMASIAQQNAGAVDSVFKGNAASVKAFADTAATKLGLSSSSYEQMASVIGSQMKNMGVPLDKVAGQTNGLIEKGADLAAMFGGSTSDAVAALSSLLRGERDPIERYGISINDAAIQAQKAKMGLKGLTGEADKNATLTATMALLNKQSADATGQFAREATSAAGAQEIANAKIADAGAKMGTVFLPAMAAGAAALGSLAGWAADNSTMLLILGGVIGGVAGAILLVNGALKAWRAATAAVAAVQVVLNAVMSANPIGLVVLAIAALVAGLIWAYQNVGWFKDFVDQAFAAIGAVVGAVAKWFTDAWNNAMIVVRAAIAAWQAGFAAVVGVIRIIVGAVVKWFTDAWNNAMIVVRAAIAAWQAGFAAAVAGVRAVVGAVVSWFVGAWNNAVNTARAIIGAVFAVISTIVKTYIGAVVATIRTIIDIAGRVGSAIRDGLAGAFNYVAGVGKYAFDSIVSAIQGVIGWVQDAIGWVSSLFGKTNDASAAAAGLGGATTAAGYLMPAVALPAGFAGGATAMFGSPSLVSAPRPRRAAGVVVNVTVNGALDPVAVGKQIDGILRKTLRRNGELVNGATPW